MQFCIPYGKHIWPHQQNHISQSQLSSGVATTRTTSGSRMSERRKLRGSSASTSASSSSFNRKWCTIAEANVTIRERARVSPGHARAPPLNGNNLHITTKRTDQREMIIPSERVYYYVVYCLRRGCIDETTCPSSIKRRGLKLHGSSQMRSSWCTNHRLSRTWITSERAVFTS